MGLVGAVFCSLHECGTVLFLNTEKNTIHLFLLNRFNVTHLSQLTVRKVKRTPIHTLCLMKVRFVIITVICILA